MTPAHARAAVLALALVLVVGLAGRPAATQDRQYQNLLTPILSGNQTVIGQEIAYPDGTPRVSAAIVVIPAAEKPAGTRTRCRSSSMRSKAK